MEKQEKISVRLTTGGIYRVSPYKAEYKKFEKYEAISISFSVELGMNLSCWQNKTIFFKDTTQINEEVQYLLKYIAPALLGKKYNVSTFKDYADALCTDINAELAKKRENKEYTILSGKIVKKRGSQYCEFEDYIPLSGDFRKNYICHLDEHKAQWFTKWELDHCIVPFEINNKNGGSSFISESVSNVPNPEVFEPFSKTINVSDLPF